MPNVALIRRFIRDWLRLHNQQVLDFARQLMRPDVAGASFEIYLQSALNDKFGPMSHWDYFLIGRIYEEELHATLMDLDAA
jgi:hypothetical protein